LRLQSKRVSRSVWGNLLVTLFLALLGAFTVLPIYYSIINSIKPLNELFLFPPRFFVYHPTMDNFKNLIKVQAQSIVPTERYIVNSVLVSLTATAGYVLVASMAAYPLAKHNFPLKKSITVLVVFAILFRTEVANVPQYIIMSKLGMIDTYFSLILPVMATSFGVFLMSQFMTAIPNEIIESCRMDGAKEVRLFFRLILPMVKPAWLTLIIFTFTAVWSSNGAQFIYSEKLKLLPAMLSQLSGAGIGRAGVASAAAVILLIPPVLIFVFSQKSVIETMAHSGLK